VDDGSAVHAAAGAVAGGTARRARRPFLAAHRARAGPAAIHRARRPRRARRRATPAETAERAVGARLADLRAGRRGVPTRGRARASFPAHHRAAVGVARLRAGLALLAGAGGAGHAGRLGFGRRRRRRAGASGVRGAAARDQRGKSSSDEDELPVAHAREFMRGAGRRGYESAKHMLSAARRSPRHRSSHTPHLQYAALFITLTLKVLTVLIPCHVDVRRRVMLNVAPCWIVIEYV